MTREELIRILTDHRKNLARAQALEMKLAGMEKEIAAAAEADMVSGGMPSIRYDIVGGGGKISSPVENSALRSADGFQSAHVVRWRAEAEALRYELEDLRLLCHRVECALSALKDKERIVIEQHLIAGDRWVLVGLKSKRLLGVEYSRGTLSAMQERGLKTMLGVLA